MNDINTLATMLLPLMGKEDKEKIKDALVAHLIANIGDIKVRELLSGLSLTKIVQKEVNEHLTAKIVEAIKNKKDFGKQFEKNIDGVIERELDYFFNDNRDFILDHTVLGEAITEVIVKKLK